MSLLQPAVNRLACIAGLTAPARPERRIVSLGMIATVLAAFVALMSLYVGVRQFTQADALGDTASYESALQLQRIVPQAGSDRLMSIEEMQRLGEQD